jgi:hypothetical protein
MVGTVGCDRSVCRPGLRRDRVVVCELCEREERNPVILVVGTVDAKVLFNDLIDNFGGTIGLQMMCGGEVYLHTQAIVKASPKVQNKLRSAIGKNRFGQSMQAENIGLEERGSRVSIDRLVALNEVRHLREAIFNYKNGVKVGR